MTQEVKEQIVELFATLKEAHEEMQIHLEEQNYTNVNTILADCQECALLIGNTIEQFENNQEKIIRELEEYYEKLYWLNSNLEEGRPINGGEIHKALDKRINEICKEVEDNIKVDL
ncbi:MAG: hypothetical protein J1E83_05920 [Lachnospiraceae bacterium]|nr:hypothetical protein [Lachnospiraceae bacterium]